MIRPGRMRERLTIQNIVETTNDLGEVERTYTNGDTVWASVNPRTAYEQNQNGRTEMFTQFSIRIRYNSSVHPTTRFLWNTKPLEIVSILEKFDSSVLEIVAVEVV